MLSWCTIGQKGSSGPFLERGRAPGECRSEQSVAGVAYVVSRRGGFAFSCTLFMEGTAKVYNFCYKESCSLNVVGR